MQSKWFADCKTTEDRQKRKELIENCRPALDILSKICYNSIRDIRKSSSDYTLPNWDYRQADAIGQESAFDAIIKLCDLTGAN